MTKASRELATSQKHAATLRRESEWEPEFIEALRECGVVTYAGRAVGVGRSTLYRHREADAAFREAWDEAVEESTDMLEREAYRRAAEGWDEEHVNNKGDVYSVRKYDGQLLQFLLRARRPGTYRERSEVHHSGSLGLSVVALAEKAREGRREIAAADGDG